MKEKLPFTMPQKFLFWAAGLILAALWIYLIAVFADMPDKIPGHYGASGEVNRWDDKWVVFLMPGIGTFLYLLMLLVSFFPDSWNTLKPPTEENRTRVLQASRDLLCTVTLIFTLVFSFISLFMANREPLGVWFLPVVLALVFGSIVVGIVRVARAHRKGDGGL